MRVKFKGEYTPLSENIKEKDHLGEYTVVDSKMNEIKSDDLKGIKIILTVPSVDTSVCSRELAKFIDILKNETITILSVSMDLPFALDRWCQSHASENIVTASDFRYHDFADASGLLMPEIGLFSRSVLLVDENDMVRYLEIVEDVSNEPDYEKVMEQLQLLKKSA